MQLRGKSFTQSKVYPGQRVLQKYPEEYIHNRCIFNFADESCSAADDFGFESNAFPAANAPSQPQQDQAANALPSPPRPSQPPTVTSSSSDPVTKTYESFDAFGQPPSGSTQPAAAKQQNADDDWDLFFSDK